jgi:hypothetical protein
MEAEMKIKKEDFDIFGDYQRVPYNNVKLSENENTLVVADVFGKGRVYHGIKDTYKNVVGMCKRKNWKFVVTGVFAGYFKAIWNDSI